MYIYMYSICSIIYDGTVQYCLDRLCWASLEIPLKDLGLKTWQI